MPSQILYFDSHPAGNCATLDSHLTTSATVIKSQTNKTPDLLTEWDYTHRDCKAGHQNTPSQKKTLVFLRHNIGPKNALHGSLISEQTLLQEIEFHLTIFLIGSSTLQIKLS